jgi:N-terminal domain of CBF1 interacting co-repressor CIR
MPLHLLHHKSWHVYNTDNIERVRRDQEKARLKEEAEELRMNKADQERRLQQLRGNAYGTEHHPINPTDPVEPPSRTIPGLKAQKGKHVNLFEDVEKSKGDGKGDGNPAREAELAAEKKKWEDMVTSKLVNATKDHLPWYSQLDRVSGVEKEKSEVEKELKEKKQMKWKEDADPLKQMERYLGKKKEVDEREDRKREKMEREMTERERRRGLGRTPERNNGRTTEYRDGRTEYRDGRSKRRSEGIEERHHISRSRSPRRHKHHRSRSPKTNIEQLRAEQMQREAAEKEKIDRLMKKSKVEERYQAVGYGGYSAQFHPEAVRR